jgi:hypothetical protein
MSHGTGINPGDGEEIGPDAIKNSNARFLKGNKNGNKLPEGDRIIVIGCHMNEQNNKIPNDKRIPGIPDAHEEPDGTIWSTQLLDLMDTVFAATQAAIENQCGKDCCESVSLSVSCPDSHVAHYESQWVRDALPKTRGTVSKCGKSFKYNCATKGWTTTTE